MAYNQCLETFHLDLYVIVMDVSLEFPVMKSVMTVDQSGASLFPLFLLDQALIPLSWS
jgi:hypothetical protein